MISVLLVLIMTISISSVAFAAEYSSFGKYDYVFIIGVDAAGGFFDRCDTPNFDRIFNGSTYTGEGISEAITISAENWGAILTGVACDVHGFTNDYIAANQRGSDSLNGTIYRYAKEKLPDADFVSFCNWAAISNGIIENDLGVNNIHYSSDAEVTDAFVKYFKAGNKPAITFVQLDEVDGAAHKYGGQSEKFFKALEKADTYIGKMYDAVCDAGLMRNGLFIVVSDHGVVKGGGHGDASPEETSEDEKAVTIAVAGKTVMKNGDISGTRNRDVAAIALYALGIDIPEHMTATVPDNLFGKEKPDFLFKSNSFLIRLSAAFEAIPKVLRKVFSIISK